MLYLTTHSTQLLTVNMSSDVWLRTTAITREETCWCHVVGYSFRLIAMAILYALSVRRDSTYHSFWYTSGNEK